MKNFFIVSVYLCLTACVSLPDGIKPVSQFDLERYLGKWYEVARLDHSFERGLEQVSAEYSLRDDGGVVVRNRGYSTSKSQWKEALGKAYFVEGADTGYLKVSFFGPFYGAYIVYQLDQQDYQYSFVSGPDRSYLWFLSRTPQVSEELKQQFVKSATELGFDSSELIWVKQPQLSATR